MLPGISSGKNEVITGDFPHAFADVLRAVDAEAQSPPSVPASHAVAAKSQRINAPINTINLPVGPLRMRLRERIKNAARGGAPSLVRRVVVVQKRSLFRR